MCEVEKSELFACQIATIKTETSLHKYQMHIKGNWSKAFPDSDQESDESSETNLDTDDKNM